MEKALGDFVVALRRADVEVSPAETLEALSAMELIGVGNRQLLHDTLSMILAKSPEEKALFDVCFDRFFSFRPMRSAAQPDRVTVSEPLTGNAAGGEPAEGEARPGRRRRDRAQAHHHSKLGHLLLSDDEAALAVLMREAASAVKLDRMRTLRERSLYTQRMLVHMGMQSLETEIERLASLPDERSRSTAEQLAAARTTLKEDVRDFVDEQYLLLVDGSGNRFIGEAVS